MTTQTAPDALLFTAPGCPHCPGVKAALEMLHDEGLVGQLEVVSVADQQERAAELGVRSVPWLKLGEYVLTGAQTPQQLREMAKRAAAEERDPADLLENLLANGELNEAQRLLDEHPAYADTLLALLKKPETALHVRIGSSALLEGLEGSDPLKALLPQLAELSQSDNHQLRSDACYLLGLTHSEEAEPPLRQRLEDESSEVREIASEALAQLKAS
ncbi:MAG: thioredoxin family protein [Pseudomonadota bacterium]